MNTKYIHKKSHGTDVKIVQMSFQKVQGSNINSKAVLINYVQICLYLIYVNFCKIGNAPMLI